MSAPPKSLDHLLLYRLARLLAVAGSMVIRLCEGRFGITRREWRLIATLARHDELGSSQLAEHAQLDRARTSKAIGSMVTKALVTRVPAAGDRRKVVLRLTSKGRALYDTLFPLVTRINDDLMASLDAPDAARLDDSLRRLQAQADRLAADADAVLPKADRRRGGGSGGAGTPGSSLRLKVAPQPATNRPRA